MRGKWKLKCPGGKGDRSGRGKRYAVYNVYDHPIESSHLTLLILFGLVFCYSCCSTAYHSITAKHLHQFARLSRQLLTQHQSNTEQRHYHSKNEGHLSSPRCRWPCRRTESLWRASLCRKSPSPVSHSNALRGVSPPSPYLLSPTYPNFVMHVPTNPTPTDSLPSDRHLLRMRRSSNRPSLRLRIPERHRQRGRELLALQLQQRRSHPGPERWQCSLR